MLFVSAGGRLVGEIVVRPVRLGPQIGGGLTLALPVAPMLELANTRSVARR